MTSKWMAGRVGVGGGRSTDRAGRTTQPPVREGRCFVDAQRLNRSGRLNGSSITRRRAHRSAELVLELLGVSVNRIAASLGTVLLTVCRFKTPIRPLLGCVEVMRLARTR
jgi:hypothetical protein